MAKARLFRGLLSGAAALIISGCATTSAPNGEIHDPWMNYNRAVYNFNDKLDRYALQPVAKGYRAVTPDFIETGIGNFFRNIDDVTVAINALLQGKITQAGQDTARLLVNSTLGLAGFIDVAGMMGLEKHDEDFGQTLGVWGVAEGPYFVIPFLGPATVRSAGGRVGDWYTDPLSYVKPTWARYGLVGGEFIDIRAQLLDASGLLATTFDPYTFMRDAYISNRRSKVLDGRSPDDADYDDAPQDDYSDELDDLLDGGDGADELDMLLGDDAAPADEPDELDLLLGDDPAPAQEPDELDLLLGD
ncbi:VacJ family lipoprotein [Granulosicoccaceae sp. 1_MG-2023]|nr:VacJ family lipoprotein [Granulosicoccaceae sp. 1_MG-2023]